MPKLIDYSVRFDLMREAVVRIAARDGGHAVNLAAVAAELKVSPSTLRRTLSSADVFPMMGVVYIDRRRRRRRRYAAPKPTMVEGSLDHARWCLLPDLPSNDEEIELERAWEELSGRGGGETIDHLREDRLAYLDNVVANVVSVLGIAEDRRELEVIRLRALVDGLVSASCRGSISGDQLTTCLDGYLGELAERGVERAAEPQAEGSRSP